LFKVLSSARLAFYNLAFAFAIFALMASFFPGGAVANAF